MERINLRLMVDLEYEAEGEDMSVLQSNLARILNIAYPKGLFTEGTEAKICSWDFDFKEIQK